MSSRSLRTARRSTMLARRRRRHNSVVRSLALELLENRRLLTSGDVQIVDDGDSGFTTQGNWTTLDETAYQNDIAFSAAGTGADRARWSFDVTPGRYRVSANWSVHPNRATDAPYTVFAGSTQLGQVDVNQELVPNDLHTDGVAWEDLGGPYDVSGNMLVIELSDQANEYVIADAVRIERIGSPVVGPEIEVRDGNALVNDGGTVNFGNTQPGVAVDKTLTVHNVGNSDLTLNALNPGNFPVGFSLQQNFGSPTLAPGASTTFVVRLQSNSAGNFAGPTFLNNNDGDENPFDLNLQGSVATIPPPPVVQIIDNGQPGFTTQGNWPLINETAFGGDIQFNEAGNGADRASWNFNVTPGSYRISATWSPHANRATDAKFSLFDGSMQVGQVSINQEQAPDDLQTDGAVWEDLGGPHSILGNVLSVDLSDQANEFVIADAVRIEYLGPAIMAPEIEVRDGSSIVPDNTDRELNQSTQKVSARESPTKS